MKYIFNIILLFITTITFGQDELVFSYETTYANLQSHYNLHIFEDFTYWEETQKPVSSNDFMQIDNPNYEFEKLYKNLATNEMYTSYKIMGPRFFVKDLVKLEWSLTEATEEVLGYNCQTATTTFRGRNYIAYYTSEIPIAEGPFKFSGLPGMILKVETNEDEYLEFVWECVGIEEYCEISPKEKQKFLKYIKDENKFDNWETYTEKWANYIERFSKNLQSKSSASPGSTTTILINGVPEIAHETLQTTGVTIKY